MKIFHTFSIQLWIQLVASNFRKSISSAAGRSRILSSLANAIACFSSCNELFPFVISVSTWMIDSPFPKTSGWLPRAQKGKGIHQRDCYLVNSCRELLVFLVWSVDSVPESEGAGVRLAGLKLYTEWGIAKRILAVSDKSSGVEYAQFPDLRSLDRCLWGIPRYWT